MECCGYSLSAVPEWAWLVILSLAAFQLLKCLKSTWTVLRFLTYSSGNLKKHGEWAVVTGSTDGIGLGYAKQFAKRGFNVVLISRDETKLKAVEETLKSKYSVQVKIIAADFSSTDDVLYNRIAGELEPLNVGVLVNNVGISYPHAQYFTEIDDSLISQLININVISMTKMTKMVLPKFVQKKKGIVINVGSAAGLIPVGDPLYAVYSATKAYVDFFSRSLNLELKSKGVIVENHVPYFVVSKLSKIRVASIATPTADDYAAAAVNKIGFGASVVPFPAHALQHWIVMSAPIFFVSWYVMSHHLGIYKRAMSKKKAN